MGVRKALGLENTWVRLSDYLYYPMMGTVPLNLLLLLAFSGTLLRSRRAPALATDWFCILNALILTPCVVVIFQVFVRMTGH